jgi:hypothetical protein
VLPAGYADAVRELAGQRGLAMHLDGARLWNAAVKRGVEPRAIAKPFDSVSVCLSKGLGAPVGSVLCGGRDFIKGARRWRKMLGGGMRQAGILAAAGRPRARASHPRLAEDHENAVRLAAGPCQASALSVAPTQTNMVFVTVRADIAEAFARYLEAAESARTEGRASAGARTLDVSRADVDAAIACVDRIFARATIAKGRYEGASIGGLLRRDRRAGCSAIRASASSIRSTCRNTGTRCAPAALRGIAARDRLLDCGDRRAEPSWLVAGVLAGTASRGRHAFFEHNRPATFTHPCTASSATGRCSATC